jgi:hypothetical protein
MGLSVDDRIILKFFHNSTLYFLTYRHDNCKQSFMSMYPQNKYRNLETRRCLKPVLFPRNIFFPPKSDHEFGCNSLLMPTAILLAIRRGATGVPAAVEAVKCCSSSPRE